MKQISSPTYLITSDVISKQYCSQPQVYQLLAHGRWFFPASSTTKTGRHDIAEKGVKTPNENNITPYCLFSFISENNLFCRIQNKSSLRIFYIALFYAETDYLKEEGI